MFGTFVGTFDAGFLSRNSCDSIAPPPRTEEFPAEDPKSAKAVGFERAKSRLF